MNAHKGTIEKIEVSGNLSLVSINVGDCHFKSIVIETPKTADYLIAGKEINVMFKESEVIIGLEDKPRISLRNRMPGTISKIEKGQLLTKLTLDTKIGEIFSIITSNAVAELGLHVGCAAVGMVKTNEVLISRC